MKLNERETKLLSILLALAVIAAGYFFLISDQITKITKLNKELKTFNDTIEVNNTALKQQGILNDRLSKLEADTEDASKQYYPAIAFGSLSYNLNQMISSTGVDLKSIVFTDAALKQVTPETAKPQITSAVDQMVGSYNNAAQNGAAATAAPAAATAAPTTSASPAAAGTDATSVNETAATGTPAAGTNAAGTTAVNKNLVYSTQASIKIAGSYSQIYNFIGKLKDGSRKIVINQVAIYMVPNKPLDATIDVTFYALPKFSGQDTEYLSWRLNLPKGTNDPFRVF